ncbi:gp436 family protein [Enterocloster lavalensis]|uniref:gp436 family protein n=1 Tax=Enterocloster lavalensis TaxID=460384 RepID=UPI001D061F08|nr:DUF1320 domain-containing protein [Enterocloster lavalensis]MCB6345413.1 DUF1320 domain-containing protein [Enterocloster lavalensis]
MAYCVTDEVIDMLKDDILNPIIGNAYIEDPAERKAAIRPLADEAITDADAEIDGYLMKRYPVPMAPVPAVISKYSKDIAVYNLISRAGIDTGERESNYLTRYKNAIAFLTKVAKGEVDIVKEGTDPAKAAATGFKIAGSPRLFSRGSMKGY